MEEEPVAYRLRGTKDLGNLRIEDGPTRDFKSLGVIEGYMRINGQKAHVLLDGGSTINMMSPNFALVHKMDLFQLKKPVKLQMATSGSRSVINFGAKAEVKIGDFKETRYFDVVNLDRYQVVLGTPFLRRHSILLNYTGSRSFKLGERWFPVQEGDFARPLHDSARGMGNETPRSIGQSKKMPSGATTSSKGKSVVDKGKPMSKQHAH
jgi:hypothetical protein